MRDGSIRTLAALVIVAALVSIGVVAASATEAIKERHEAMEAVGDAMKALGAIAKKEAPFSVDVVRSNATIIAAKLEEASALFPEGSDKGDVETWAKAEIWTDRGGFDKGFQATIEAAAALKSVDDEAKFAPALGALGNGCKGCHDTYRRPRR